MKIKLTENKLKQIVAESVKKVLLKEDPTCWYGDTKPFETIYQMADKIVVSLEAKFTPEYYEGWPDDFSYEDMYEWAKKVRDDAGEYINCNSRFISTNFVAESVKKVLSESYWSGGEYYEDQEEMYIGRTSAYYGYDDDDDDIYEPDYWTYDEDPNCKEFAGEVYALNADGISELNWWLNCQRSNEYQRRNTFNHNNMSREQMWNHLTDPSSHLSTLVRE